MPDADGDGATDLCDQCPDGDDGVDADGDGLPDDCDEIALVPGDVFITIDPDELGSATVTLDNASDTSMTYEISSMEGECGWLSVDTGGVVPTAGVAPAEGVAQFEVHADSAGLVPGDYLCTLSLTSDHPDYPSIGSVDVTLEVDEPGFDITHPGDATMPAGIEGPFWLHVADEAGEDAGGLEVVFEIVGGAEEGVFWAESGDEVLEIVTDGGGAAEGTFELPPGFEGTIVVEVVVVDPESGEEIGHFSVERVWETPTGRILWWVINGGGAIVSMPADFSEEPIPVYGSLLGGPCVGCHTVGGQAHPVSGGPQMFVANTGTGTLEVVDPVSGALLNSFPSPFIGSGDTDYSPDASTVAYGMDGVIRTHDLITDVDAPIGITSVPGTRAMFPTFSSDGSHLAYVRDTGVWLILPDATIDEAGSSSIWTVAADGSGQVELIPAEAGATLFYPEFSPDGRWLAYNKSYTDMAGGPAASSYSSSTAELWIAPVDPAGSQLTGVPRRLDNANGEAGWSNSWPTWAPDGAFLAFASNRVDPGGADWDVYISAISNEGNSSPAVELPYAGGPGGQHIPAWGP
jgi:Tol biopolymer transport system component